MELIIVIISIIGITFAAWLLRKYLKFKICPICAGVALTWLWLLMGIISNQLPAASYQLLIAVLMGGTVVGAMFKLEKFIKPDFILLWKTIFVISGFLAAYSLINTDWAMFAIGVILAVVITLFLKTRGVGQEKQELKKTKELEEKMRNCC